MLHADRYCTTSPKINNLTFLIYKNLSNLIRIHSPENLTSQETYKSERAQAVKKKIELEDSVDPIYSEIFRLYYISPSQAKATIEELFASSSGDSSYTPIQITEEITTRSIIVRGKEKDLDVVDKVIKEIDIRTKQVLIEAFIVEANSGGGMIVVCANGNKEIISIKINPEVLEEDVDLLEDLVLAATNQALAKASEAAEEKMNSATGGLMGQFKMPGM